MVKSKKSTFQSAVPPNKKLTQFSQTDLDPKTVHTVFTVEELNDVLADRPSGGESMGFHPCPWGVLGVIEGKQMQKPMENLGQPRGKSKFYSYQTCGFPLYKSIFLWTGHSRSRKHKKYLHDLECELGQLE